MNRHTPTMAGLCLTLLFAACGGTDEAPSNDTSADVLSTADTDTAPAGDALEGNPPATDISSDPATEDSATSADAAVIADGDDEETDSSESPPEVMDGASDPTTEDVSVPDDVMTIPDGETGQGPQGLPDNMEMEIGQDACCLSVSGDRAVWSEGGDIWIHTFSTGVTEVFDDQDTEQTQPVLSGDRLVWADARNGDRDLWMANLATGESGELYSDLGDQDEPWLDGTTLVFLSRHKAPHSDKEADVWVLDVESGGPATALTDDIVEQAYPHVHGDRVVWTDFRNDPEGVYSDQVDPYENNGDIYGHDLALGVDFIVTDDLAKQLRPAIDGEDVVWMDWRGINPEPKYSEFMVYTRHVSADLVTYGEERLVAWSSWDVPDLWQRPSVLNGVAAWIANPEGGDFNTAVFASPLSEGTLDPMLVTGSTGTLEAVSLTMDGIVWIGGGHLGAQMLTILSDQ